MPIKYYLRPFRVSSTPNQHSAKILIQQSHDLDSIVQAMLRRGSTLTEADIRASLMLAFDVISKEVAAGNSVNLPLVNIRPSIHGLFSSVSDSYEEGRHNKKASLSAGKLLWDCMNEAAVEKLVQAYAAPLPMEYLDVSSQHINSTLTPNGIGQLAGDELKFDDINPAEGIFLTHSSGHSTKVEVVAVRNPKQLMFSIPVGLAAGNYHLEVRKAYGNEQSIRIGRLGHLLQVF
jgi:hypothetical protein